MEHLSVPRSHSRLLPAGTSAPANFPTDPSYLLTAITLTSDTFACQNTRIPQISNMLASASVTGHQHRSSRYFPDSRLQKTWPIFPVAMAPDRGGFILRAAHSDPVSSPSGPQQDHSRHRPNSAIRQ